MTVTDAAGKSKKYEYDMMMRIWRVTEPDSSGQLTQVTTLAYDDAGNMTQRTKGPTLAAGSRTTRTTKSTG